MNPFFKKLIVDSVKRKYKKNRKEHSPSEFARDVQRTKATFLHFIKDNSLMVLGVAVAGFGLKGFLLPNSFIDGGVVGIALLVKEISGISLSLMLILINIPFLLIGFKHIGRTFSIKSIAAIVLLAVVVQFIEYPIVTDDKLLIAVFGGFFLGLGIGLAMRGGAVLDGSELLAVYLSKKSSLTIGDVLMVFNVVLFVVAAYVLSVEIALYAILTYLAASKTVDFVLNGIEEYTAVTVISGRHEEIRRMITEKLGRGCTLYHTKSGYSANGGNLNDSLAVYTIVTRMELARLQTEIDKIDEKAFVIMNSIKDTRGGMIKKRPFSH